MKKKFSSLNDVRKEIDIVDKKLLDLFSERKKLVDEAVKQKTEDQIIDEVRIESIIKNLNLIAKKKEIPEGLIETIWREMISRFIDYEKKFFKEKKK